MNTAEKWPTRHCLSKVPQKLLSERKAPQSKKAFEKMVYSKYFVLCKKQCTKNDDKNRSVSVQRPTKNFKWVKKV